jgi:Uri superfamily endonuclease
MTDFPSLPAVRGVYVLHLFLLRSQTLGCGRLGQYHFPAGHYYFYVGSARGTGGLQAHVGRHLCGTGALHWHIDYLRAVAEIRNVFYTVTDIPLECAWGQAVAQLPHAFIPVLHFVGPAIVDRAVERTSLDLRATPTSFACRVPWQKSPPPRSALFISADPQIR